MNHCITKPNLASTAGQWSLDDLEALQLLDQIQEDYSCYEVNNDEGDVVEFRLPSHPETQCFIDRLQLGIHCRKQRPLASLRTTKDIQGNKKLSVQYAKDLPIQLIAALPSIFSLPVSGTYTVSVELETIHSVIQDLSDTERFVLGIFTSTSVYTNEQAQAYVDALNRFQNLLNERMSSAKVRKRLHNRKDSRLKTKEKMIELVHALLHVHSKILVVRVDLGIIRTPESLINHHISSDQWKSEQDSQFLLKALERLNENARMNRMKHALGYIHRIEYGPQKGYHVHAYYFFDGQDHWADITWGQYIAKQWQHVTNNQGSVFICNMKKEDYRYCALGMLDYSDVEMLKNLEQSFDYLCKNDQYFQFTTQKRIRGFRISQPPEISEVKMGCPRKHDQSHLKFSSALS
ncbi:inovirus-type Gp2 protein [Acinetobacter baumannii]|uniref:inovirus-type Gp2 protein n=1 Tax=Acinetobacter baumannii TaxID=470 RepID=UPI0010581B78|nr:inovirus-type Gp2 protein [Acinetobacter baumannii]MCY3197920.1 inovirus Gp2 family protein [Acinetobacter baumannii]MCZ3010254.1 inovirus Gp2 family protein [Acinetobacter baumannii]MDC4478209.1 inovirus Gp2 family protein [Acinetobacter baumannii]MDC4643561.1 inovirus Gp2 family protein [Acinetobacter baumannii]MDC4872092.1 inovirus Gp2 family protein [Acinetobacter baumannii]